MDVVLDGLDSMVLDGLWSKMQPEWERDNVYRQAISVRSSSAQPSSAWPGLCCACPLD